MTGSSAARADVLIADVLFVDVLPFRHSTRTRKMALALSRSIPDLRVEAVTFQRVGRTGIADPRAAYSEEGVHVRQVALPRPRTGASLPSMVTNLLVVYPVGLVRLTRAALDVRARLVVVGNTSLVWLGALHRRRHHSEMVVNARERLAGVRTRGSLASVASRLEPLLGRLLSQPWVTVTSVCESHAAEFRAAGARRVIVVRNVALSSFLPDRFVPTPTGQPLTVALVGSLYPGRGIEPAIRAVARLKREELTVKLEITGRAGQAYADSLAELVRAEGVADRVLLLGPCDPADVAARYAAAHIGTALYESVDAANDSLSNKIFECAASGRAVLAGSLPENVALVERHGLGWTSEVTAEGIARQLRVLAEDPPDFDALGAHCLDVCRTTLNWEQEFQPLLDVLRDGTDEREENRR